MLQARTSGQDDYGGQLTSWVNVAPVRFSMVSTGGKKIESASSSRAQSIFQISMRWLPNVDASMRILLGTRALNFTNVNDVENRHRDLEIAAIEGASPE